MDITVASILNAKRGLQGQTARNVLPQLERARGLIAEERNIVDAALKSALAWNGGAPKLEKSAHAGPQQRLAATPAVEQQPIAPPGSSDPAPHQISHPALRSLRPLHPADVALPAAHADGGPAAPYQRLRDLALRSLRPLPTASAAQPAASRPGGSGYLRQVFGLA